MLKKIIIILLIMGPTLFFGFIDKPTIMGLSLIAGALTAMMLNLEKFKSFKAGNIEAQLREVESSLNDALATIDELKEMSEPLMNYTMVNILRGHTFFGLPPEDREKLYIEIRKNSLKFGINSDYNNGLLKEFKHHIVKTYLEAIGAYADKHFGWSADGELVEFYNQYHFRTEKALPSYSELNTFFDMHPSLVNEEVKKYLIEYERVYKEYCIE